MLATTSPRPCAVGSGLEGWLVTLADDLTACFALTISGSLRAIIRSRAARFADVEPLRCRYLSSRILLLFSIDLSHPHKRESPVCTTSGDCKCESSLGGTAYIAKRIFLQSLWLKRVDNVA